MAPNSFIKLLVANGSAGNTRKAAALARKSLTVSSNFNLSQQITARSCCSVARTT